MGSASNKEDHALWSGEENRTRMNQRESRAGMCPVVLGHREQREEERDGCDACTAIHRACLQVVLQVPSRSCEASAPTCGYRSCRRRSVCVSQSVPPPAGPSLRLI
jgi:hypothetical protein